MPWSNLFGFAKILFHETDELLSNTISFKCVTRESTGAKNTYDQI